jgi:hypothetical protein
MAERPPSDPDDWFGEPEPLTDESRSSLLAKRRTIARTGSPGAGEDWMRPAAVAVGARGRGSRRWLSIGIVLAGGVVLLVVLAAAGVFSSSPSKRAKPPPAHPTPTVAQTQTTSSTTATSAPAAPSATLKAGESGASVRLLQRALAYLGFPVGNVDGVYGPATQSALARFQRSKGLVADGVLGPATLQALAVALGH